MAKVDDTEPVVEDTASDVNGIVEFNGIANEVPRVDDKNPNMESIAELDGIAENEKMATNL